MVNSYMDAHTGQRLLLYDGDLDEAVGMLLESCGTELGADTSTRESLSVLTIPDAFPDCALSEEKHECSAAAAGPDKCHYSHPGHKESLENAKWDMNEAFCKMGNNDSNGELPRPENLADTTVVQKGSESPSRVRVPKPTSSSTQPEGSVLRPESGSILKGCKSQSEPVTKSIQMELTILIF